MRLNTRIRQFIAARFPKRMQNFFYALWLAGSRFYNEEYSYRASALTYTTLLALVPLVSVVVSLVAHFPRLFKFVELAQSYVLTNLVPTENDSIQHYLELFTQQASHLPLMGIMFLFLTASLLIITVEDAFNQIWEIPVQRTNFLAWMLYWAVLLAAPLAIGLSVFLSTLVFSISWFSKVAIIKTTWLVVVSLFINAALFSALYIIVPSKQIGIRNGIFGGVLAAVLFEIAKKSFAFYIHRFANYTLIYGALSTIPIFLIWVYISWFIVLFGALFTQTSYQLKTLK